MIVRGSLSLHEHLQMEVAKGVKHSYWLNIPDTLQAEMDSGSLTLKGRSWLSAWTRGWIGFPHTDAAPPCIHDLHARHKNVALLHGVEEFDGLTATWTSESPDVEIVNGGPVSAYIAGYFPPSSTRDVTYTISHPDYFCGLTNFTQELRFCPQLDETTAELYNPDNDPNWTEDFTSDDIDFEDGTTEAEAEDAYTNALARAAVTHGVLYLHGSGTPANDYVSLSVPTGPVRRCCGCPDHEQVNSAALAYRSPRLRVLGSDGVDFTGTETDCDVDVLPEMPSREIGDARLLFTTNGVIHKECAYTVLGLSMECYGNVSLDTYNELSPSLGYPFVIHTNLDYKASMELKSDVLFTNGVYRLALTNATGRIQVWADAWVETEPNYWHDIYHPPILLLDSSESAERYFTALQWQAMVLRRGSGRSLPVYLTSDSAGHCDLDFSYVRELSTGSLHAHTRQRITSITPLLVPDFDRDGDIDGDDAQRCATNRFYFWTNTDIWRGDNAFEGGFLDWIRNLRYDDNGDDNVVNGRNDLVNLLPLAIRLQDVLNAWSTHNVKVVVASKAAQTVRRRYADISWDEVRKSVLADVETDDESSWWQVFDDATLNEAHLRYLDASGDELQQTVVNRSAQGRGVILVEAKHFCKDPFEVRIYVDEVAVFSSGLDITFTDIDGMYRWHNLRTFAGGGDVADPSGSEPVPEPRGLPDSECDNADFFFVHGYNVSEREAREWGRAVFKRMWWSGLKARFHVVTWFGNDTQVYVPGNGLVSPDYHVNVEHALKTSTNLCAIASLYGGPNYFAAHSLGNMLVSSAIQDWSMPFDRYFMINGAVAGEAFDISQQSLSAEYKARMTPTEWTGFRDEFRAADWWETAGFESDDARRSLTWKGRFGGVDKVVNYYSDEDEVLMCGYGEDRFPISRDYAWYNQERYKGVMPDLMGRNEAGWSFNPRYTVGTQTGQAPSDYEWRPPTVAEAEAVTDDPRESPIFGPFQDGSLWTTNKVSSISRDMISQLLADAIPAETLPAGYEGVPKWNDDESISVNKNMASEFKDNLQIYFWASDKKWIHSFFVQAPYMVVHRLFEDIATKTREIE